MLSFANFERNSSAFRLISGVQYYIQFVLQNGKTKSNCDYESTEHRFQKHVSKLRDYLRPKLMISEVAVSHYDQFNDRVKLLDKRKQIYYN